MQHVHLKKKQTFSNVVAEFFMCLIGKANCNQRLHILIGLPVHLSYQLFSKNVKIFHCMINLSVSPWD